ncbi:glycoside hydrolase family 38 [Anopheles sinensis]|uniref:Glycoside hydrolase family 38 n=1 Tax=Anopheles sinensis TaxID=74873 RepID=A0A084WB65_ANOSI|nr:glycoside hydrolase family 38 [Anopheles sinensis]
MAICVFPFSDFGFSRAPRGKGACPFPQPAQSSAPSPYRIGKSLFPWQATHPFVQQKDTRWK